MHMYEKNIFYFAPHQDDEISNFGVSVIRDVDAGHHVVCVLCTDGGASSARRLIGNGQSCHLHEGKHLYPLTVEEFSAARDREFFACCGTMGLAPEDIRISPLRARDGQLTTEQARAIVLDAIGLLPPEQVEVKTFAPVTVTPQNPDHTAIAVAAEELYRAGAFSRLTRFYEAIFLDRTDAPQYPLERLLPDADQKERYRRAADCYGVWRPQEGRFAIGHHSVKDEFDMMTADPVTLIVKE